MSRHLSGAACALALALTGLTASGGGKPAPASPPAKKQLAWNLTSKAFRNNGRIPVKHTGDGRDVSPELSWTAPAAGTAQLALICDDPDAPAGTWTHWVLYGLPADRRSVPEGVPRTEVLPKLGGARQGRNSWGAIGYRGPSPPRGPVHHYHFRLYALNARLTLRPRADRAAVEKAMKGHIVGRTELIGLYSR